MKLARLLAAVSALAAAVVFGGGVALAQGPGCESAHLSPRLRPVARVAIRAVTTAADVLGVDRADIVAHLRDGESLAEIAGDKKSALVDALLAPRLVHLQQHVADGSITAAQAEALQAFWRAEATEWLGRRFVVRRQLQ